jgi:hypothetical protein
MSRRLSLGWAGLLALSLGGCGGGGYSSSPPPPSANYDVAAAVIGIATANEVFTLSGNVSGMPASLQAAHAAMPNANFSTFGTLNVFRRTATLTNAGTTSSSYEDDYVDLSARIFYGLIDSAGDSAVSTARSPYPSTAQIGTSGLLYDATTYDAAATPIGKTHVSWSLEAVPGNADAAYLCVNTDFQDLSGASTGDREYDCYAIATDGHRLGMRVTFVSPSFGSVVFQ